MLLIFVLFIASNDDNGIRSSKKFSDIVRIKYKNKSTKKSDADTDSQEDEVDPKVNFIL